MIEVAVIHTFLLIGPAGEASVLRAADVDDIDIDHVLDAVADAVASRLTDPEEHEVVRAAAQRAFARAEEMPGTIAMAGERIPGDRLVRVFRHLAGEGPVN